MSYSFQFSIACCSCEDVVPDESCCLQSNRLFDEGRLPITRERRDMVFPDIPGLSPIQALDFAVPYLMPAMYEWMRKYYSRFRRTDVILVNTFYDMEKPVLDALRNQVIGSPDMQVGDYNDVTIFSDCEQLCSCCSVC